MTDWIEYNGGPQPVDDDVWVEVSTAKRAALPFHTQARFVADWRIIRRYRFLNQHLIDAALKRGVELGLEAAATHLTEGGWIPEIRELDPDTIAREAVLDQLTREAQAQGTGYDND